MAERLFRERTKTGMEQEYMESDIVDLWYAV